MLYEERKRWVFFGLPFTFTKYTIEEEKLIVNHGFFKTVEDDCYIYKIMDVKLERTLLERLFKLGTVVCYTSDVTDGVLKLHHIHNSKEIMDFIFEKSEEQRRKRRTLNTVNLSQGLDGFDDVD